MAGQDKTAKAIISIIAKQIAIAVDAIILMIALGNVHDHVSPVPAFGYWTCLLITWTIISIIGTATHRFEDKN